MKKSRTVRPTAGVESPTTRRLPLVELLIDTEAELFDLSRSCNAHSRAAELRFSPIDS